MTKENLIKMIQSKFSNSEISKFLKEYDNEESEKVLDLYNKEKYKNFKYQDWYDLSETYKKDKEMQIALVLHPAIPDDIVYKIVANKSYQSVYLAAISCRNKVMPKNAVTYL